MTDYKSDASNIAARLNCNVSVEVELFERVQTRIENRILPQKSLANSNIFF